VGQLVTVPYQTSNRLLVFSAKDFFYDYKRLDGVVVLAFMFYMNWTLTWIVIVAMPILVVITRVFQRKMQVAFEEVRCTNCQYEFVCTERVTGMKIVQLFTKKVIEADKFQILITNKKKHGLKPFFTTPSSFLLPTSFHR
jgi:ABC-type multidrug transport system fused ATPase/permease subunit